VIEDTVIASNLSLLFEADWGIATPYEPKVRGGLQEPMDGLYSSVFGDERGSSNVSVALYVTPEMGVAPIASALGSARRDIRVWLSEAETGALVKGRNWTNPLLDSLAKASMVGTHVRVIVEQRYLSMLQGWSMNVSGGNIKVRALLNGLSVHAKAAIIDNETSLVSSMNWVFNSMYKNREIGVLLKDKRVSSYLASVFERDWSGNPGDPIARISMPGTATVGQDIHISGIGSMDDVSVERFVWAVDGANASNAPEFTHVFESPGIHTVKLTVIDSSANSNSTSARIEVSEGTVIQFGGSYSGAWQFDMLLMAIGCGSLWSIRKRNKGKLKRENRRSF
jgi:hypothetical protein